MFRKLGVIAAVGMAGGLQRYMQLDTREDLAFQFQVLFGVQDYILDAGLGV